MDSTLPLKRVKHSREAMFDFKLFFGDLVDDEEKETYRKHRIDFYSLFHNKSCEDFSDVKGVLFLTFSLSRELLQPLIKAKIPVVVASDCSSNIEEPILQTSKSNPNYLVYFPRKKVMSYCCSSFHPKLILIKFSSFLRVVIGSGNLLEQDWIVWENIFMMKDYPFRLPSKSTHMADQLKHFLSFIFDSKYDSIKNFLDLDLREYDCSESQFYLVPSLPSRWTLGSDFNYGLNQLKTIYSTHKPKTLFTPENVSFLYVTSSVGNLQSKFILDFVQCFFEKSKEPLNFDQKEKILSKTKVYYPSRNFTEKSKYGVKSASCLFLSRDHYETFKFQKRVLRQFERKSKENTRIPHLKIFIISNNGEELNDDSIIYIGSHNFTQAAWGRLELDQSQVCINNYELGIIVPPLKNSTLAKQALLNQFDLKLDTEGFDENIKPYFSN